MKNLVKKTLFKSFDKDSPIREVLVRMILIMAGINIVFYLISLARGFEFRMLLGFLIGYFYVCACYIYVANTVENAVDMPEKKAKRSVISCYVIRYIGLFLLCFFGTEFKLFNMLGVVIPQFYPRIALSIISFIDKKSV